jgi:hypothetical protein
MRKTEENPEHYENFEKYNGYAFMFMIFIMLIMIVYACVKIKQSENCEAYHTGNTNHKRGK